MSLQSSIFGGQHLYVALSGPASHGTDPTSKAAAAGKIT